MTLCSLRRSCVWLARLTWSALLLQSGTVRPRPPVAAPSFTDGHPTAAPAAMTAADSAAALLQSHHHHANGTQLTEYASH
uniref:Secreted protein n=1 Tax=Angiostrongylus cantonensis TaxID=6313 RepID=A0A0K0CTP6_ANGCA